ncbi:MAG: hypothetical protein AAGA48_12615 [Myxococcota bacterium]
MTRWFGMVAMFLTMACQSEPEPSQPVIPEIPEITPGPTTSTFDTGGGLMAQDTKYVRELRINAFIAWNAVEQRIIDIQLGGQTFISAFEMRLAVAEGLDSDDPKDRCSVVVRLTGFEADKKPDLEELFRLSIPFGLETPLGVKQVFSECEEREFTGEQYPEGVTMEDYWASLDWSMSLLGGPLDADLEGRLASEGIDTELYAQGAQDGAYRSGTFGHLTFWRAFEMDETGFIEGTADEITAPRLTREQMTSGPVGNPPTAYYVFDQLVQWNLADELDLDP